jgi:hypothetical protein
LIPSYTPIDSWIFISLQLIPPATVLLKEKKEKQEEEKKNNNEEIRQTH